MARGKRNGVKSKLLEAMLGNTSWLVSHAMALNEEGRAQEAETEWLRAGQHEEQVACLLEAEGHDTEAGVHHVSAASCYARVHDYVRAVTLLRSALSFTLRQAYRREVEKLLDEWRPKARKQLRRHAREKLATTP
jgi:hypothetical protein